MKSPKEQGQPEEWFDHRKRVDWDDPITKIIEGMVRELEGRPDWRGMKLDIFKSSPTTFQTRGKNKGQVTMACGRYNEHYNSLFHVAVRALREGYQMAQEGGPFAVLEAELIADAAWPEEDDDRGRDGDGWDWWWKGHRPWGYT